MPKRQPQSNRLQILSKKRAKKFSRGYLLFLLLLISILFFKVVQIFLVTILLAAVFTALFYPLYEKFLKLFRNNRSISAILCCVVLLLGLLAPVYTIADLVSREAIDLYKTAEAKITEIINKGDEGFLGTVKNHRLVKQFNLDTIDWQASLKDIAKNTANIIGKVINKTSRGTFQVLTDLFITPF
ncbi:MAG: AI-2E family transporter, partial [bacterium]